MDNVRVVIVFGFWEKVCFSWNLNGTVDGGREVKAKRKIRRYVHYTLSISLPLLQYITHYTTTVDGKTKYTCTQAGR